MMTLSFIVTFLLLLGMKVAPSGPDMQVSLLAVSALLSLNNQMARLPKPRSADDVAFDEGLAQSLAQDQIYQTHRQILDERVNSRGLHSLDRLIRRRGQCGADRIAKPCLRTAMPPWTQLSGKPIAMPFQCNESIEILLL
jgi:hypothetical protein